MVKHVYWIHKQVQQQIEVSNAKYKSVADAHCWKVVFDVGDYVWVVLTKDRILAAMNNKLHDKKIGPCEIVKKINDNVY